MGACMHDESPCVATVVRIVIISFSNCIYQSLPPHPRPLRSCTRYSVAVGLRYTSEEVQINNERTRTQWLRDLANAPHILCMFTR